MIRFGLCCIFRKEPIHFKTTTAAHFIKRHKDKKRLAAIILHNIASLLQSLDYCEKNKIFSFRVVSTFFPLYSHPKFHYKIEELPFSDDILKGLALVKKEGKKKKIRLTFHPDQFTVLNSPSKSVTLNSLRIIESHASLADYLGGDEITLHGGGGYGDKPKSLQRLSVHLNYLSDSARKKLALENDERIFTPEDLLEICRHEKMPFVYDVHHHRCLPDTLSIDEATAAALKTWGRKEPLFHISSPLNGWNSSKPHPHHDYINPKDFPKCWFALDRATIEVEAKAKELAVLKLMHFVEKKINEMENII